MLLLFIHNKRIILYIPNLSSHSLMQAYCLLSVTNLYWLCVRHKTYTTPAWLLLWINSAQFSLMSSRLGLMLKNLCSEQQCVGTDGKPRASRSHDPSCWDMVMPRWNGERSLMLGSKPKADPMLLCFEVTQWLHRQLHRHASKSIIMLHRMVYIIKYYSNIHSKYSWLTQWIFLSVK